MMNYLFSEFDILEYPKSNLIAFGVWTMWLLSYGVCAHTFHLIIINYVLVQVGFPLHVVTDEPEMFVKTRLTSGCNY